MMSFEDFYSMSEEEARAHGDVVKEGPRVTWIGTRGAVIKVPSEYARSFDGNVFSKEKLAAIRDAVRSGAHPTILMGYGRASLVDKDLVDEDRSAFDHHELLAGRPLDKRDIGQLLFQVRDGNHRSFGALIAGEPYIWMIVARSQMQDVKEYRAAKKQGSLEDYKAEFGKGHFTLMSKLDRML